ncbi:MAG: prepilin-type N-terminal cleavage/methylation domain-containing protein [Thermodesulfovibrio sp.]
MLLQSKKGLTLVEVAIVLVILGLLVGLGASLIGPLTKRAKLTETRDIVNAATESVIGFTAKNNRLPTSTEFPQVVRNPNDSWGKGLVYFVDSALTNPPSNPAEGICGRKTTNVIVCTDANCNNQIQNVAFIVVSGGPNYNVQTGPLTNSPCPPGKTCYRVYPQDTPNIDDYSGDFTRQQEYDDIVKWVSLDELRIKAGCQGAQLKILNNELPYGYVGQSYEAKIYAEGGVPFSSGGKYRWCIEVNPSLSGFDVSQLTISSDCLGLAEASWRQADYITISGTPNTPGTYLLTFFARDNQDPTGSNDNIAQKTLVLTINPFGGGGGGGGGCTSYALSISNQGTSKSFRINSGTCTNLDTGANIYISGLSGTDVLTVYINTWCWGTILLSGTMQNLDTNGDCQVNVSCQGNNCIAN